MKNSMKLNVQTLKSLTVKEQTESVGGRCDAVNSMQGGGGGSGH